MEIVDASTLRAWWKLEDFFALFDNQKAAIRIQIRLADMQEVYIWNASTLVLNKEVDLNTNDMVRMKHALTTAIHHSQDRVWLEPPLAQLDA